MATLTASVPCKKRVAIDTPAVACPAAKKTVKDTPASFSVSVCGVPGWQYPPLPVGMIPPIPYCMAGNPYFPFMGMFPPFWFPAAAMAAATMPALASAANGGVMAAVPGMSGMSALQSASTAMWSMLPNTVAVQPTPSAAMPMLLPVRANSDVSSVATLPSTSCTNSVPTIGASQAAASPPLLAASQVSVCNDGPKQSPEDDEFANFIDSFLFTANAEPALCSGDGDWSEPSASDVLQAGDMFSTGGSSSSNATTDEGVCLTHNDSQSLLRILGGDMSLTYL